MTKKDYSKYRYCKKCGVKILEVIKAGTGFLFYKMKLLNTTSVITPYVCDKCRGIKND